MRLEIVPAGAGSAGAITEDHSHGPNRFEEEAYYVVEFPFTGGERGDVERMIARYVWAGVG